MAKSKAKCRTCRGVMPDRPAGTPGPPPLDCPTCKSGRAHRRSGRLRVVQDRQPTTDIETPPPPPPGPASASSPDAPPADRSLLAAVNRDLAGIDSDHPAAESLAEAARILAAAADHPLTRVDARQVAVLVKELRATLADLTRQEAVDDDSIFDVSAPVVVPASS